MNTFKKKAAICESAAGSVIKPLELNQNQGTVTIDYRAYYHMHHDSLMLHLLLSCNDEKVRYQMLDDFLKERAFLGHGYKAAQCPVTDADAICFVYGINPGTVDRMLSLCDVYLEGAIA